MLLVILPLGAGALYIYLGAPQLPGKPYAARKNNADFTMETEAERLAAQLEQMPDADGYKHLADTYFMLHRYDQAVETYRKIIALNGGSAAIWSELGEALAMARDGLVVPEAHAAFTKALKLDSHDARARFYMGLAETQINEPRRAVAIWRDLEKDSPPDAPWLAMLKEHIASFAQQGGLAPEAVPPAPPSTASPHGMAGLGAITPAQPPVVSPEVPSAITSADAPSGVDRQAAAAVMAMKPDAQNAMIRTMVDRLAAKMQANPNDLDGWDRLARAYHVLGETAKAADADSKAAALRAKASGK